MTPSTGWRRPSAKDYKTAEAWQKDVALWRKQRELMLTQFPPLAARLAETKDSIEGVWQATEQHWFDILDRIGTRKVAIEAAKQSKDYDLLDQLYLSQELDYDQLNEDVAVHYFNPTTDFNTIPGGAPGKEPFGPKSLRTDQFGNQYLERTKILPDFNKWRYDRMNMEEKAKFEREREVRHRDEGRHRQGQGLWQLRCDVRAGVEEEQVAHGGVLPRITRASARSGPRTTTTSGSSAASAS